MARPNIATTPGRVVHVDTGRRRRDCRRGPITSARAAIGSLVREFTGSDKDGRTLAC